MAKIQRIKKSRKAYKCSRCGCTIEAGSSYYRGEVNFGPTIIRCTSCGLESWEVTTSDYQLAVGEIAYRWEDNYELHESVIDDIVTELDSIKDDMEERLNNMPEGLQYSENGQLLQDRIDTLENVVNDLLCIEIEELKQDAVDDICSVYYGADAEYDYDEECEKDAELRSKLEEAFNEKLRESIQSSIDLLEV